MKLEQKCQENKENLISRRNLFKGAIALAGGLCLTNLDYAQKSNFDYTKESKKILIDNFRPKINNYIYVPSIGLYIAKQRTHLGLNWYQTHEELQKENLRMPTIFEFKEFLRYLKQNPDGINDADSLEVKSILDDILTPRNPFYNRRAEWLDARFEGRKEKMNIHYLHKMQKGKLVAQKIEPLDEYLIETIFGAIDLNYWISNSTKQGLPLTNNPRGEGCFWDPINDYVANFDVDSDRACLECSAKPDISWGGIYKRGVFASLEPKNIN